MGAVCVPKTLYAPAPAGLTSKRTADTPDAGGAAPSLALASTAIAPET